MQKRLASELPPSDAYKYVVEAEDVFSNYQFSYPMTCQKNEEIPGVMISINTKPAYFPTTGISDKGLTD